LSLTIKNGHTLKDRSINKSWAGKKPPLTKKSKNIITDFCSKFIRRHSGGHFSVRIANKKQAEKLFDWQILMWEL
jgi:hypothetical protein